VSAGFLAGLKKLAVAELREKRDAVLKELTALGSIHRWNEDFAGAHQRQREETAI